MILEDFLNEEDKVVDNNFRNEIKKNITDNMVDKVIHLIKHRKKKIEDKDMNHIIYALKQGGIVE